MLFADLGEDSGLSVGPTALERMPVSHPPMMPMGFLPIEVSDGGMAAANGRSPMPPQLRPMVRTEQRSAYYFGDFRLGDDVSLDPRPRASISTSRLSPLSTNPDQGLTTRNPGGPLTTNPSDLTTRNPGTPLPTDPDADAAPGPSYKTAPAPFLPLPPKEPLPETQPTTSRRFPWWWILIGLGVAGAAGGAVYYLRR
jgi:hypothetical protein